MKSVMDMAPLSTFTNYGNNSKQQGSGDSGQDTGRTGPGAHSPREGRGCGSGKQHGTQDRMGNNVLA